MVGVQHRNDSIILGEFMLIQIKLSLLPIDQIIAFRDGIMVRTSFRIHSKQILFFLKGSLSGVTVAGITGNSGSWSYLLTNPTGISVDPFGILYILDTGNGRVLRWIQGASYGTTVVASLSNPYGLTISSRGSLIVADTANHRVLSYSMNCRKRFFLFLQWK